MILTLIADESLSGIPLNESIEKIPELEKLKAELEEAKDKYLRKVAEFENFKRRNAKRKNRANPDSGQRSDY